MTTDEPSHWLILGRYRVLDELGRGAMGIVYKVHDERLDRVIALKTIRKDRLLAQGESEQEVLDRFRREARAAGKLSHPGVVTIYDISEEGSDLYLAMEFVDGDSLGQRMHATPCLPVAEAAGIAVRLCEVLEHAHAHGVIHRDVKPDNIMCCANGDVKLTDFGIARMISGPATHIGRPMGTPRYMAPEQWRGDLVDGRADVYAVGIILYEMLTGSPTFTGKTPTELRERVLHEEPAPLTLRNPALPAAIDPVVRRAIAREPADRHATAGELALALAPFAVGVVPASRDEPEDAVAGPDSAPDDATDSDATVATLAGHEPAVVARRRAIGPPTVALVVAALALAGAWWARQPPRSLPMPPAVGVAPTVARDAVARMEETTAAATVTAAAPTPELSSAHRDAGATLADPAQADTTKLAVIATLTSDASDAATDILLGATRNASILVSMAAVKALDGRPCARIVGPLTALLVDEEWQRRAWAAKILGGDGCVGARAALVARRGDETDARVAKLVDDAIKMLDEKEAGR